MKILQYALIALACSVAGAQMQPVLTRSADNARTGDFQDSTLTVANVKARGIVRTTTIPVIGDARGMEAQPLILPNVKVADGSIHDVMVLPSMAGVVRGVDAHTGAGIWQTTLCNPIQGSVAIDMHLINDKWSVLSTPVIDSGLAYMVPWCSPDGTPQKGVHFIYTVRVSNGDIVGTPVSLAGLKNGNQGYSDTMRKQRSSLVLTTVNGRKTLFFAYGTVLETGRAAAGAIVAYDLSLKKITAFLPMSQGLGAGIWMGGQGLGADSAGNLYGVTGNGSFNGVNDFGESIFKVAYTPPNELGQGMLSVVSWWSPYSDAGRVGLDPTKSGPAAPVTAKLAGVSAPSAEIEADMPVGGAMAMPKNTRLVISHDVNTGQMVPLVYPTNPTDPGWSDEDLGSGGCTLIEKYGKLLCGGKDGLAYVVNTSNMGNTMPVDFANAKANCAKLATPPVWFTMSPGPVDPCPQDTTMLNFMPWGKTRHIHMTPVQYWSPKSGLVIFVGGENSPVQAWSMAPSGALTYLANGNEIASSAVENSPGGMPGSFAALSSNNNALGTAVLWVVQPFGNSNEQITNGRLIAYDAEPTDWTLRADGSKQIPVLWRSDQWGIQFTQNKFMNAVIDGGKVFLPDYSGGVQVFALTGSN